LRIGSLIVDFCWMDRRLIVETDGYRYHRGRAAFEDDRARDLRLHALGYEVLRLSHRQVFDESAEVAAVLHAALERSGAH
jgi:very-short-patch-repair endonuclease